MTENDDALEVRGSADIGTFSPAKIRGVIRDELRLLVHPTDGSAGRTQLDLALELGYSDQSSLSRILNNDDRALPLEKAKILDSNGYQTSVGVSFAELVRGLRKSHARARSRTSGALHDVFVASPMASADKYERTRRRALELAETIENHTGLTTYFAGREIPTEEEFEQVDIAWAVNRDALKSSRCFVLYVTEVLTKPSSVWVEAGMALALGIPSIYFVPNVDALPYILQRAVLPRDRGGAEVVTVHYFNVRKTEPHRLVRTHGRDFFREYLI